MSQEVFLKYFWKIVEVILKPSLSLNSDSQICIPLPATRLIPTTISYPFCKLNRTGLRFIWSTSLKSRPFSLVMICPLKLKNELKTVYQCLYEFMVQTPQSISLYLDNCCSGCGYCSHYLKVKRLRLSIQHPRLEWRVTKRKHLRKGFTYLILRPLVRVDHSFLA